MISPYAAPAHTLPKAAQAILALPGVESLEREPDGWCCHLAHGWTTAALNGGGTVIDSNLATVRAFVRGAYQLPAAPAPTAPAPELPAFVTQQQQQQQPQQGREYRYPARGGRVAWDEPGESAAALAADLRNAGPARYLSSGAPFRPAEPRRTWHAAALAPAPAPETEPTPRTPADAQAAQGLAAIRQARIDRAQALARHQALRPRGPQTLAGMAQAIRQAQALPPAPAPARQTVAPGPLARKAAPARLPADVAALLQRFNLSLDSLLTVGASNAKLAKGAALAWPVILHHLPARSLRAALVGPEAASTAPRSRLPGLADLAKATGTLALGVAHNGCPWASKGCADGCLAWAGHGGMGTAPAAARARRTLAYLADSPAYARAILWAIAKAYRQAQGKGLPLAVRLRGTDDLAWHLQRLTVSPAEAVSLARRYGLPVAPGQGQTLAEALSLAPAGSLHLYDYSKAPVDGPLGLRAQQSAGWDVTASLAADRPDGALAAIRAVQAGFRLAVPVALAKGSALPAVLVIERGPLAVDLACIPGDDTDHRWADPAGPYRGCDGVAVVLRTKVSRGRGADADSFSLQPLTDAWQPLAGGGRAMLRSQPWGQG